jgi:hypothetical protein
MAHDAGRDLTARRHFGRALALVQVGATSSSPRTS